MWDRLWGVGLRPSISRNSHWIYICDFHHYMVWTVIKSVFCVFKFIIIEIFSEGLVVSTTDWHQIRGSVLTTPSDNKYRLYNIPTDTVLHMVTVYTK